MGETGRSLRKRLNNPRNRLKKLSCQYLYQHFNSDGHTEDDISIDLISAANLQVTHLCTDQLFLADFASNLRTTKTSYVVR